MRAGCNAARVVLVLSVVNTSASYIARSLSARWQLHKGTGLRPRPATYLTVNNP